MHFDLSEEIEHCLTSLDKYKYRQVKNEFQERFGTDAMIGEICSIRMYATGLQTKDGLEPYSSDFHFDKVAATQAADATWAHYTE